MGSFTSSGVALFGSTVARPWVSVTFSTLSGAVSASSELKLFDLGSPISVADADGSTARNDTVLRTLESFAERTALDAVTTGVDVPSAINSATSWFYDAGNLPARPKNTKAPVRPFQVSLGRAQ